MSFLDYASGARNRLARSATCSPQRQPRRALRPRMASSESAQRRKVPASLPASATPASSSGVVTGVVAGLGGGGVDAAPAPATAGWVAVGAAGAAIVPPTAAFPGMDICPGVTIRSAPAPAMEPPGGSRSGPTQPPPKSANAKHMPPSQRRNGKAKGGLVRVFAATALCLIPKPRSPPVDAVQQAARGWPRDDARACAALSQLAHTDLFEWHTWPAGKARADRCSTRRTAA
jgi:hypothetical protein